MAEPEIIVETESAPSAEDGAITFLFTDIEDSTGHWQRQPQAMAEAQARHNDLMRSAAAAEQGQVFRTVGDSFCIAFTVAGRAAAAALTVQRELHRASHKHASPLTLRVRMALHYGPSETRDGDFTGLAPARTARLLEIAHGGQILLTGETVARIRNCLSEGATLHELGPARLRSFVGNESVFQLLHPEAPAIFAPLRSVADTPNNLPRQLTPFIGREREVAEAKHRIAIFPLVTLTGTGGCGKTRLALQVSDYLFGNFPDGIYFVDLARVAADDLVAASVAASLSLPLESSRETIDQIAAWLAAKRLLLILDNCEHVLGAAAALTEMLLQAAPNLHLLATSREPLGIAGETVFPLEPMSVPSLKSREAPGELARYDAVRLFAERAAASIPSFALSPDNVFAIARICHRVDGLPLAVVLTAAWSNVLTPAEIEERLKDRFRLLRATGTRSIPMRHQTLRATIDWGYTLLTEPERALLRRCAIFVGGWTLEAAEAVCAGSPVEDVLDTLSALARKSLLYSEETPDGNRYRLLDTIAEYALELLREQGEHAAIRARHRDYFTDFASEIAPYLTSTESKLALERVDRQLENLRAALDASGNVTTGLCLVSSLFWYWHVRGYIKEGLRWAEAFLRLDATFPSTDTHARAKARNGAGILAWDAGDRVTAKRYFTEALAIFREIGDLEPIAGCLSNLGSIASQSGDYTASRTWLEESLKIYEGTGNMAGYTTVLANLGVTIRQMGDLSSALKRLEEALALQRDFSQPLSIATTLYNLASILIELKEWAPAKIFLRESLQIRLAADHRPGIALCLDMLPLLLEGEHEHRRAALLLGTADGLRSSSDVPRQQDVQQEIDTLRSRLQEILGQDELTRQEVQGRELKLVGAVKTAFETGGTP